MNDPYFLEIFNSYFQGIRFKKKKETGNYSVYYACIQSGLATVKRYALLFIDKRYPYPETVYIKDVNWKSLQTRELKDSYSLPQQRLQPRNVPNVPLVAIERNFEFTRYYNEELQYDVILLHDVSRNSAYQHYKNISIETALDSFKAVFTKIEPVETQLISSISLM